MNRILLLILAMVSVVSAADLCVKPKGDGSKNGSDWNNAMDWSTMSFTRGNRYFLAGFGEDSVYICRTLTTAVSGSTVIEIRKATTSSHVSNDGWKAAYYDSQAVFDTYNSSTSVNGLTMTTSYWTINGVTGEDSTGYGFKFRRPDGYCDMLEYGVQFPLGGTAAPVSYISIQYCEFKGCGPSHNYSQGCIYSPSVVAHDYMYGIYIGHNYIHDYGRAIFIRKWKNSTIEYNFCQRGWSTALNHGEGVSEGGGMSNTWRYNLFKNYVGTSHWCFGKGDDFGYSDSFKIYGNIFINDPTYYAGDEYRIGNGTIGVEYRELMRNFEVYNNTFIGIIGQGSGGGVYCGTGTGNIVKNNLYYHVTHPHTNVEAGGSADIDFNTFTSCSGTLNTGDSNVTTTGNPFTDSLNGDYSLTHAIHGDSITSSDANIGIDMFGRSRGSDGVWDRGAIEYGTQTVKRKMRLKW